MTEIQNCTLPFDKKTLLLLNFVSMQFWTEISNQSGSQIHAWILLKKNLLYQNLLYHLNDFNDLNFFLKSNQNLSRLWPIEAIHREKDLPCKK